jgi:two-component system LytT family sensor kinase
MSGNGAKFSVYPSWHSRLASHLLLWTMVFSLLLVICKGLFGAEYVSAVILIYTLVVVSVIICNHYFLSYVTLPLLEKKIWVVPLHLLLVYIFSSIFTIMPLEYLARAYPEVKLLKKQSELYNIHHLWDVFTYGAFLWFVSLVLFYNILAFFLKYAKDYYETNQDRLSLIREKNIMEVNFLRSQIQPHFLFNTLNNIYGLVIENEKASQSIIKLSDLLRFSLYESSKGNVTIEREVSFLTDYIHLEQMRHKDKRVSISYNFDDIEDNQQKIKPLLIVNFIENAFKHGINASVNYSWVNIILKSKQNVVTFTIENNRPIRSAAKTKVESGVGLVNVRRRLDLEYPERYDLSIKDTVDTYEVKLTLRIDD